MQIVDEKATKLGTKQIIKDNSSDSLLGKFYYIN